MSDDLTLYIVAVICFVLILCCFRYGKVFAGVNLAIFTLYNIVLHSFMFLHGGGGSAFLWWFYLAIATFIQLVIVSIYLIIKYLKK